MHGNQVPVIELSFIDNFSWKKLSLNLIREVAGLEQEEYMYENCRDNKYFLINLDTEVRNNDSITKIWLCKVMSEKRGWQVTKSPPLNPPLESIGKVQRWVKEKLLKSYRPATTMKKWWFSLFVNKVNVSVVVTWWLFQGTNSNRKITHLEFRSYITLVLINLRIRLG